MSISLDLPPELESKLALAAGERGISLADYIVQLLENGNSRPQAKSGADLVSYWQKEGLIGSRPDIAAPSEHARAIREEAEARRKG